MTTSELKETCRKKGISFIPHHECGLCGQPTGWYLFERWPPYEVAYSSACGCCYSEARRSTWQKVLDWVCDKDGTLRPEYEFLQPDPDEHKASSIERIKTELLARKEKYTRRGEESDAMHDGKGMYWGDVLSALNEVLTLVEQIERRTDPMMTHDEISRFFSEEDVKKAFQLPDWPAGTEVVYYCRSTDSRDAIEQIAQQRQWKIVEYVHIDELPIAKLYKPGLVALAKRESLEWKRDSTMPSYEEWRNQMLGGLCPSDWDKFKTNY